MQANCHVYAVSRRSVCQRFFFEIARIVMYMRCRGSGRRYQGNPPRKNLASRLGARPTCANPTSAGRGGVCHLDCAPAVFKQHGVFAFFRELALLGASRVI